MHKLLKQLPLQVKLALIGMVPVIFMVVLSVQLYREKNNKLNLLGSYIERMHQSAAITKLIDNLQVEKRYSFEYTLKKDSYDQLLLQRPKTDLAIKNLSAYKTSLSDFSSYTFLNDLSSMRKAVDSSRSNLTMVMDYYTNVIFRFNTLNALPTGSDVYLEPVYKDLAAQKLLSEMSTFLGIISANIYNALYTHQYMSEILMGTRGVYLIYGTYEKELLLKASPDVLSTFNKLKTTTAIGPVTRYLDSLFRSFSYDSAYTYYQWGKLSFSATDELRTFQQNILQKAIFRVNNIYKTERLAKQNTLILLVLILLFVAALVTYIIKLITGVLAELKQAAQKISRGETGFHLNIRSHDAIEALANSIAEIEQNNRQLAAAANAIGHGDFTVHVQPRSQNDILGNAVVAMKTNLRQLVSDLQNAREKINEFNKQLEKTVTERTAQLETVNKELEAFSYSVSHDLRAPLRAISGYAAKLKEQYIQYLDPEALRLIHVIIAKSKMMGQLIDDLIALASTGQKELHMQSVDMKKMAALSVAACLEHEKEIKYKIIIDDIPSCKGDTNLLKQVWMNLIDNAVKYSSRTKDPRIKISAEEDPLFYTYIISDNGVGFDMQYYEKLFGVFQRLHNQDVYQGTGIGLALAKRIINKHYGEITASSSPGNGATFYFTIPKIN